MRFYENELLVYTRSSFSRISAPKIYPKIDEKNDRKMKHFFGPFLEGLGSHSVTILGSKSHLKIDQKINAILDRFLNDFGPILGSMWGPLRAPGCHRDAPKTLQDALKTLPRCSQDAQGCQYGTPRGPKRAQHTAKLDFNRISIDFHRFSIDFLLNYHGFF